MRSRRSQWAFDQVIEDNGRDGEGGIGEEETNVTALEGLRLEDLLEPEPADGVLRGERRQDFVGEIKAGV